MLRVTFNTGSRICSDCTFHKNYKFKSSNQDWKVLLHVSKLKYESSIQFFRRILLRNNQCYVSLSTLVQGFALIAHFIRIINSKVPAWIGKCFFMFLNKSMNLQWSCTVLEIDPSVNKVIKIYVVLMSHCPSFSKKGGLKHYWVVEEASYLD